MSTFRERGLRMGKGGGLGGVSVRRRMCLTIFIYTYSNPSNEITAIKLDPSQQSTKLYVW